MKRYILYLVCIATLDVSVTPTATAGNSGFGGSFAGGLTGSLVGTSLCNAMTAPRTVYVQGSNDSDDYEQPQPRQSKTNRRKKQKEQRSEPYPKHHKDAHSRDKSIRLQELQVERARLEREAAEAKARALREERMLLEEQRKNQDVEFVGESIGFEEKQYN